MTAPKTKTPTGLEEEEGIIQPMHSYLLSLTMILVSEIGDKTFLIAALMAMKHDRVLVFTAAFAALITMTVLSAVLGHAVPTLLPQRFTNFLAAVLFLIFGAKMLKEGLAMSPTEGVTAEMQEVEMELEEKEQELREQGRRRGSSISPYQLEMGLGRTRKSRSKSRMPSPPRSPSSSRGSSPTPGSAVSNAMAGLTNLVSLLLSPAWVQTFVMTFLGEWGDRSQIATIAMAAGQDYWWVTGGAISGHAVCTGVAVIGGRAIAGKVSLRTGKFHLSYTGDSMLTDYPQLPSSVPLPSSSSASSTFLRRHMVAKNCEGMEFLRSWRCSGERCMIFHTARTAQPRIFWQPLGRATVF